MTFISYESSDKATAFKICEYLESRGQKCWIAPRDIHAGEYAGEITRALKSAGSLVVVCSTHTSKSPHVRNEVSLAFGDRCKIIPFMIDDVTLDDSLEYYFAGKQRVFVKGKMDNGLRELAEILGVERNNIEPEQRRSKTYPALWILIVILTLLAAFAVIYFLNSREDQSIDNKAIPEKVIDEIKEVSEKEEEKINEETSNITVEPVKTKVADRHLDSFSGAVRNGYPNGSGTYTFKKARRIDVHDSKAREAKPGDYIIGEWENGHLIQGKWYSADGSLIEVLLIGKAPNPEGDHIFEKCEMQ